MASKYQPKLPMSILSMLTDVSVHLWDIFISAYDIASRATVLAKGLLEALKMTYTHVRELERMSLFKIIFCHL